MIARSAPLFRRLLTALSLVAVVAVAFPTGLAAQSAKPLSKKEQKKLKKEWKTKAKAFVKNPIALRDNQDYFKKKIDELNKLIAERDVRLQEQEQKLAEAEAMKGTIAALQSENATLKQAAEEAAKRPQGPDLKGLVFKVQIGAFKLFNLAQYIQDTPGLAAESGGELNKYTLGVFRDLATAEAFRKDIRRMGIRDAWTVAFRDGVRIEMKTAKAELGIK